MMTLRGPHGSRDENLGSKLLWKKYMTEVTDWREIDSQDAATWPNEGAFFWGLLNTPGRECVDYCFRHHLPQSDELVVSSAWYDRDDTTGIAAWCPVHRPGYPKKFTSISEEAMGYLSNDALREKRTPEMIGREWVRLDDCLPMDRLAADYGRQLLWFYDHKGTTRQGIYVGSGYIRFAFGNSIYIRDAFGFIDAWRVVLKPDITGGYYPINW